MKKNFKYDYNYKVLIITNLVSILFLSLFIISFGKKNVGSVLLVLMFLVNFLNSWLFIFNQGIHVNSDNIIIVDYFWVTKIRISDVKSVELIELKKEKKNNLYGFFHEYYHYSTYMRHCNYVYNNGKVFKIVFYLKNGSKRESYYGWLYKEKKNKKVNFVVRKLKEFLKEINELCKNE